MEVQLICSENIQIILKDILANRKIKITENAEFCIVEKGFDLPTDKIGIYFSLETIHILIKYLKEISGAKESAKNIITGRCDEKDIKILNYDDIYYFEAMGNDVYCKTKDNRYKVKEKLYELEDKLYGNGFIRISKCFIVNIIKVDRIISWFNSKLILKLINIDEQVYVTRKYLDDFKKYLGF